jgi:hypothetical protein
MTLEKLQSELKEANWYYEYYWKVSVDADLKIKAMKLLIKELEAQIAKMSNGEKNELEE